MSTNFVEELRWRGILYDIMPGTEDLLNKQSVSGYIGFDPTADSLHIGSLIPVIILMHFQRAGHKPIALVGGATGMIGDPSGKSNERKLLDKDTLDKNSSAIKAQLERFLDFKSSCSNVAEMVNNYTWIKNISLIDFVRDIGKHITVNYMMSKDSVKNRLQEDCVSGMSFTEFTYQLLQGYDFYHLYKTKNCLLQIGGSDQWGNITTGAELIRKKDKGKSYAITCPLITKSDGTKFGKSQGENIWLDKTKTSVYKFYQYWLNISDEDAQSYIKKFTFLDRKTIENLIKEHKKAPYLRLLQKNIAKEVTIMVHSVQEYEKVLKASSILFGKSTHNDLKELDEQTFLDIFEGVPQAEIHRDCITDGLDIVATFVEIGFLNSNSEVRRALKESSICINKEKVNQNYKLSLKDLIANKYILLQRGKKNYFLIKIKDINSKETS